MHQQIITIKTKGQGLIEFTEDVRCAVREAKMAAGLCHLFCRHTSAGLIIQENADPSAKFDLEQFIKRLVPENDPAFTHTLEGADDMPSHIKSVLTGMSLTIPILRHELALGTWQGIYLWEFRTRPQAREVIVSLAG